MKSIKSLQTKKLHIKDEGGVWGNNPRMAFITIGKIRWTGQLCALAHTHLKVTQNIGMNYLYFYHWNINPRQSGFGSSLLRYYLNFFKLKKCYLWFFWVDKTPSRTCAIPSSQPRITSCLPILNLNGLSRSREESNFRPSVREPEDLRGKGRGHEKQEMRLEHQINRLCYYCSVLSGGFSVPLTHV